MGEHNTRRNKGSAKAVVPLVNPTKIDINQKGTKIKRGVKPWPEGGSADRKEAAQRREEFVDLMILTKRTY
jgi:hypothetical protein